VDTPEFNRGDGVWNNGEGFRAQSTQDADYGGFLGYEATGGIPEIGVEAADIHDAGPIYGGPIGWHSYTWTDPLTGQAYPVKRFVGYLRPGHLPPLQPGSPIEDAAFELFTTDFGVHLEPAKNRLAIVLGGYATTGAPAIDSGGRFSYPGTRPDGLVPGIGGEPSRAGGPIFVAKAPSGYTLVGGYIVTRIFGRPEVFALQRTRELRKAVEIMLKLPTTDPRHPPGVRVLGQGDSVCCVIAGGSFGSLTSQALITAWPAEFHGGFGNVFGSGPHRVFADQMHFAYVAQKPGFFPYGGAYLPSDTLEWATAFRYIDRSPGHHGWSYFDLSPLVRKRLGQFHRPIVLYEPDEDTIGHGTDFLPLITGQRAHVGVHQSATSPVFAYTSVDRRCHDAGFFTTPVQQIPNATSPIDAAMELLDLAWNSWTSNPNPPQPPALVNDGTEDAYSWVFDRVYAPPSTSPTDPLVLDSTFGSGGRVAGHGLMLGLGESLKVFPIAGVPSIFVGSADGVVTRFVLDSDPQSPTFRELVAAAQSLPLSNGAFALAVGEFDEAHSGPEVAVGCRTRLFVLDAATLALVPGRVHDLDFEHTSPSAMQIGNVFDHVDYTGEEIAFLSLAGHLVVMSGDNFGTMTDLGEPGLTDFLIHSSGSYSAFAETISPVPLTLFSTRGHLANVTLNNVVSPTSTNPPPAKLHCWTEGQEGLASDLEYVTSPTGMPVVVAAFATEGRYGHATLPNITSVRAFDAFTLMPVQQGTHGMPAELGRSQFTTRVVDITVLDIAPVHFSNSGALAGFVVLTGSKIAWFPISGANAGLPQGYILDGFPPAARSLAVTTADLIPYGSGEQFRDEIVLSTQSGHVVWFHLEDMIAGNDEYLSLPNTNRTQPPTTNNLRNTNRTMAGTWGMVVHDEGSGTKLFLAEQAGGLWEMDMISGAVNWRGDFRDALDDNGQIKPQRIASPVRDLVVFGSLGADVTSQVVRVQGALPQTFWLETTPWQDAFSNVLNPFWWRVGPNGDTNKRIQPWLPAIDGFAPLMFAGDKIAVGSGAQGTTQQWHWWGGDIDTAPNLVQGMYADASTVRQSWYSTKNFTVNNSAPNPTPAWYGRAASDCKDLRNSTPGSLSPATHHQQSLRLAQDGHGVILVLSTPGGRVTVLEGGDVAAGDHGKILWDHTDGAPDDGNGAMALAVRSLPGGVVDIFVGIVCTHLDPAPFLAGTGPGKITGGVRWLRWTRQSGGSGLLVPMGSLRHLDPTAGDPRGGFGVCGLAVGDLLTTNAGDELVVTTLEGDLFVFAAPAAGGDLSTASPLFRTWVPGALGVCNSILLQDDGSGGAKELFCGGSLGVWKWKVTGL
jgi:hypothetical protein